MRPKLAVQRIESDDVIAETTAESMPNDAELSLEELSAAYSKLICEPAESEIEHLTSLESIAHELPSQDSSTGNESDLASGGHGLVSGRSIIEAVLFVGNPGNAGLKPEGVASLMRGVQPTEIVEWIAELNQLYVERGHAMRIVEDGLGFRMQLAPEQQSMRDAMNGKLRETQLTQAAIDCLSLVAYRPGISRDDLERLWNRSASSVLGLLVRRELLRIEREGKGKQAVTRYFTTDRFLNLIGIASLDDLPMAESEYE